MTNRLQNASPLGGKGHPFQGLGEEDVFFLALFRRVLKMLASVAF